jgi:uncharacterized protein
MPITEGDELPPLVLKALSLVEDIQKQNDVAHSQDHVRNVLRNCQVILREISCDSEIVLLAACLHDVIARQSLIDPGSSAEFSAKSAPEILDGLQISVAAIQRVSGCIRTASWEHHVRGGVPNDVESYVLRDADLLEAIGARGIARLFAFAGAHRLSLDWTGIRTDSLRRLQPDVRKLDESPFRHFETKLLWIRELMFSNTAKSEADRRHSVLLRYIEQYASELSWGQTS